jgi:hypothetical protein
MSVLKVNQIRTKIRSMFEPHIDLSDISSNDAERDQKIVSRCLAAMAIHLQTGCTEKEAGESVWDGADDNGIDAAFFDAATSRVVFVQAKWINKGAGEPEAKDIGSFVKGVEDAVEQADTSFHSRLHGKFADISLRIGTPGTQIHAVVVSTGISALAVHGKTILDGLLFDLNGDDPQPIATSEVLGLTEIYAALASDSTLGTVPLDATILEWSYVSSPYPAYLESLMGFSSRSGGRPSAVDWCLGTSGMPLDRPKSIRRLDSRRKQRRRDFGISTTELP